MNPPNLLAALAPVQSSKRGRSTKDAKTLHTTPFPHEGREASPHPQGGEAGLRAFRAPSYFRVLS